MSAGSMMPHFVQRQTVQGVLSSWRANEFSDTGSAESGLPATVFACVMLRIYPVSRVKQEQGKSKKAP